MSFEQVPELVECRLDLSVGAFEERVDRAADVVPDLGRDLGDCEARRCLLLEPLRGLAIRLAPPPSMEERRHDASIGRPVSAL